MAPCGHKEPLILDLSRFLGVFWGADFRSAQPGRLCHRSVGRSKMNAVRRRDSNLPLGVGLVLSVILHAAVIVPMLMAAFTSHGPTSRMQPARFNPEDFRPPEEEAEMPPPEVQLGIDAPTPSTLTWIGYEEYQEHLAALAEFEQAAFTDDPSGGPRNGPRPPETAAPPEDALTQTPEQQDATEERLKNEIEQAAPPAASAALSELSEEDIIAIANWLDGLAAYAGPKPEEPTETQRQPEAIDPLARWLQHIEAIARERQTQPQEKAEPQPTEAEEEEVTPPAVEPAPPEVGEHAEKESDATSIVEVPLNEMEPGHPIARPGLEVSPRKPQFTTLTLLTASPGNPLVEIRFGRDGLPAKAVILESSGDSRVDHAFEASLYRWRASGKALSKLAGEQTITVRIRIILNPRAVKKPGG